MDSWMEQKYTCDFCLFSSNFYGEKNGLLADIMSWDMINTVMLRWEM